MVFCVGSLYNLDVIDQGQTAVIQDRKRSAGYSSDQADASVAAKSRRAELDAINRMLTDKREDGRRCSPSASSLPEWAESIREEAEALMVKAGRTRLVAVIADDDRHASEVRNVLAKAFAGSTEAHGSPVCSAPSEIIIDAILYDKKRAIGSSRAPMTASLAAHFDQDGAAAQEFAVLCMRASVLVAEGIEHTARGPSFLLSVLREVAEKRTPRLIRGGHSARTTLISLGLGCILDSDSEELRSMLSCGVVVSCVDSIPFRLGSVIHARPRVPKPCEREGSVSEVSLPPAAELTSVAPFTSAAPPGVAEDRGRETHEDRAAVPIATDDLRNIAIIPRDREQVPIVRALLRHSGVIFPIIGKTDRAVLTRVEHLFYTEDREGTRRLAARFEELRSYISRATKKIDYYVRFYDPPFGAGRRSSLDEVSAFRKAHSELRYEQRKSDEMHGEVVLDKRRLYGSGQYDAFSVRGAYCDEHDLKLLGIIWASIYEMHERNRGAESLSIELSQSDLLRLAGKPTQSPSSIEWLERSLFRLSNLFVTYREVVRTTHDGVARDHLRELADTPLVQSERIKHGRGVFFRVEIPARWKTFFLKSPALSFVDKTLFAALPSYAFHLFNFMSTHMARSIGTNARYSPAGFFSEEEIAGRGAVFVEMNLQEWRDTLGAGVLALPVKDGGTYLIRSRPLEGTEFRREFFSALDSLSSLGLLAYHSRPDYYYDEKGRRHDTLKILIKRLATSVADTALAKSGTEPGQRPGAVSKAERGSRKASELDAFRRDALEVLGIGFSVSQKRRARKQTSTSALNETEG